MHGKTTLVLTDKKTGNIVKEIEESNMITGVLSSIFKLPSVYICYDSLSGSFKGLMPIYQHLMKGLVLLGNTVPENTNNFLMAGKQNIIATAGDEYAQSDTMRGSFNTASSGETGNGYRFVWDFAPEKATGTIRSICLAHRFFGNSGTPHMNTSQSYLLVNAYDVSGNSSQGITLLRANKGTVFAQIGDTDFYSYELSSDYITIHKCRLFNEKEINICTPLGLVFVDTVKIELSFTGSVANFSTFYDSTQKIFYVISCQSRHENNSQFFNVEYLKIDPTGKQEPYFSETIQTYIPYRTATSAAIFNDKIYVSDADRNVTVCSMSGITEETFEVDMYNIYKFFTYKGILACECDRPSSTRRYMYFFDKYPRMFCLGDCGHSLIESNIVKEPYCFAENSTYLYLVLRTDYMATINNLSAPLEKTDLHALQVRYEITND